MEAAQRTKALANQRFLANVKTTLRLMEYSKDLTLAQKREARRECATFLAKDNLNYPPSLRALGLNENMDLYERREKLGLHTLPYTEKDEAVVEFQNLMATSTRKSLKANWIWRIGQEAREKAEEGWYGFFCTLTLDPHQLLYHGIPSAQFFWEDGTEFRNWLHNLAKISAKACGQPRAIKNGASDRDFVQHVGVIEHGKSGSHHHMHLLVWMRDVPPSWKRDPNKNVRDPKRRVIDFCRPMRSTWPWSLPGIGDMKYFRHEGDQWSRLGFHLPYLPKKQKVCVAHVPETAY
jgi:hypothetical protein